MITKAQKTARKAVKTRQARDRLFNKYGEDTYDVAKLMVEGLDSNQIADELFMGQPTVAARMANINRAGQLNELVYNCNF